MSDTILRRQKARQDLVDIFRYLAREGGYRIARRFFNRSEATFTRLAGLPGMGTRYEHDHPVLAGLRYFPVSGFRKYIVFYRPVAAGIEVVRVLHGARDINHIWLKEFAVDADSKGDEVADESTA